MDTVSSFNEFFNFSTKFHNNNFSIPGICTYRFVAFIVFLQMHK